MRFFLRWKLLTPRKLAYLPHILTRSEKLFIFLLAAAALFSAATLVSRAYLKLTVPAPQIGGSYTEGITGELRAINPIYASTDAERDISRLVFSSLFAYSGKGELKPDLAESYEISEDGKTYTVYLKKNGRWHDGKNITAEDIIFTVKTIQNPQYKSPLRQNWQGVEAEKINDYAVKFVLRVPYAQFAENLALGVIPKHLWEGIKPEQAFLNELNLKPVGSGPYKFADFSQKKDGALLSYELKRNPYYHSEGPYLKNITFVFFAGEEETVSAWRRNEIDGFAPLSSASLQNLSVRKSVLYRINMPRIFGLFFNGKQTAALSDKNVRKAVAMALNKKEISSALSYAGAVPLDYALPPKAKWQNPENDVYPFNPQAARELLLKAGFGDADNDGIMERKKRSKKNKEETETLKFKLTTPDWPDLVKTAEAAKKSLKEIGIELELDIKPYAELESKIIRPRNFEILLFGQVYGYETDPFAFWHSSQIKDPGLNISLYANAKVDKLLEEARREKNPLARAQKYKEAQKIINDDLPAVFLFFQLYFYLLPEDMKIPALNEISLPSDRFNEINLWYRETKRIWK